MMSGVSLSSLCKAMFLFAFLTVPFVSSGQVEKKNYENSAPLSYDNPYYWYDTGTSVDSSKVDVFYVLPTCVYDWKGPCGYERNHANVASPYHRRRMDRSNVAAFEIFADSTNFFSPYYRQISLEGWTESDEVIQSRTELATADIRAAFRHFIEHLNNGRPFILAGYSQGAKCLVEIMKDMDQTTYKRMIAAYVCGFAVTEEDVRSCSTIVPATGETDTGVTIAFTSLSDISALSSVNRNSAFVINPLSWTTDSLAHSAGNTLSVRIDPDAKVLVVEGVDPASCYKANLSALFPPGNLHLLELSLYKDSLRNNVLQRIRSFRQKNPVHGISPVK